MADIASLKVSFGPALGDADDATIERYRALLARAYGVDSLDRADVVASTLSAAPVLAERLGPDQVAAWRECEAASRGDFRVTWSEGLMSTEHRELGLRLRGADVRAGYADFEARAGHLVDRMLGFGADDELVASQESDLETDDGVGGPAETSVLELPDTRRHRGLLYSTTGTPSPCVRPIAGPTSGPHSSPHTGLATSTSR